MFSHSFIIWRAVEANKFIRRRWEREFIFIRLSLSLDPLSSQLFSIFIEWPKNNQWRKSRMNHEMTVQTDVKLQNIGPVWFRTTYGSGTISKLKRSESTWFVGLHCYKQRKKKLIWVNFACSLKVASWCHFALKTKHLMTSKIDFFSKIFAKSVNIKTQIAGFW